MVKTQRQYRIVMAGGKMLMRTGGAVTRLAQLSHNRRREEFY